MNPDISIVDEKCNNIQQTCDDELVVYYVVFCDVVSDVYCVICRSDPI